MRVADTVGRRFGDFEVTGYLGRGGMAVVFRAKDPAGEEVALKVLVEPDDDPEAQTRRARFARETAEAQKLEHPNLVKVHGGGEDDEGNLYYAMELVQGRPLDEWLEDVKLPSYDDAVHVIKGVCRGLAYLHERDLVHRDLKPGNIFKVDDAERGVLLGDFGLLKPLHVSDLTAANERVGTPAYMSPEQFKGKTVDRRSDIYQLGVLLYRLLTGRVPFTAPNFFKLGIAHMTKRPPRPRELNPDIPPHLEEVLLRCLEKKPEDRFENAIELDRELNRYFVKKELIAARRESSDLGSVADPRARPASSARLVQPPPPARAPGPKVWPSALAGLALAVPVGLQAGLHLDVLGALAVAVAAAAALAVVVHLAPRGEGERGHLLGVWAVLVAGAWVVEVGWRPGESLHGVKALSLVLGVEVFLVLSTTRDIWRRREVALEWRLLILVSGLHALAWVLEVLTGASVAQVAAGEANLMARDQLAYLAPLRAPMAYGRLAHLPLLALFQFTLGLRDMGAERPLPALRALLDALVAIMVALALGRAAEAALTGPW